MDSNKIFKARILAGWAGFRRLAELRDGEVICRNDFIHAWARLRDKARSTGNAAGGRQGHES
jgi:hypothetical protein